MMMRNADCSGSRPFLRINYRPVVANATANGQHIHQSRDFEAQFDHLTRAKAAVTKYS